MENEGMSISLGDIWHAVKKNLILIISIVLLTTIVGAVYTFAFTTPKYESTSSIVVQVSVPSNKNEDYDILESLRYVETVKDMLTENKLLMPIAEENGLSYYQLKGMINISNIESSSLIRITVEDVDPARAQTLANAIAQRAVDEAQTGGLFFFAAGYIKRSGDALPGRYSSPNKTMLLMVSFLIGCVLAFAVVFIIEFASKKFKKKDEIEPYLGERIIGEFISDKDLDKTNKGHHKDGNLELFKLEPATIRAMEPYNKLLTNISYSNIDNPYKVIMFTSTVMSELKSTSAANLAYCMVNNKKKAIVLDLDLRLPAVHKFFNMEKGEGVVEYLDGTLTLDEAIKHTAEGVDFISAGKNVINPVVILESKKLSELIDKLKEMYDYVILDTPPVSVCTDPIIASKLADCIIYNISMNQADKKLIKESINDLKEANGNVIGVNITKIKDLTQSSYYSSYYYYSEEHKRNS